MSKIYGINRPVPVETAEATIVTVGEDRFIVVTKEAVEIARLLVRSTDNDGVILQKIDGLCKLLPDVGSNCSVVVKP